MIVDDRASRGVGRSRFHDRNQTHSRKRREMPSTAVSCSCSSSARESELLWNRPTQGREEV